MIELNKLNDLEDSIKNCLDEIKNFREKLNFIKQNYLLCTINIALKKQKMKNLKKVKDFLNIQLKNWVTQLNTTKNIKNQKLFSKLFNNYSTLQNDLILFNKNNEMVKKRGLLIIDTLIQKLTKKMEKVKTKFNEEFNSIFYEKKSDINEIFYLFKIIKIVKDQNPIDEFINNFKLILRNTILETSINNLISLKAIPIQEDIFSHKNKFSFFKNLYIEENILLENLPKLFQQFLNFSNIFKLYYEKDSEIEIKKILFEKRNIFFTLFEKKVSKILLLLFQNLKNYNKKNKIFSNQQNFLLFLTYINLFLESLKFNFEIKESFHIDKMLKYIVYINLQYTLKYHIRKICFNLSSETWKRIPINDKNEIFSIYKNKINIFYKKFFSVFNDNNFIINIKNETNSKYENIQELYEKILEDKNLIKDLIINNQENDNFQILSKTIDNSKIILSNSAFSLIKSIREISDYLILFDNIKYNNFIQILNLFDYYLLSSVNMLIIQKRYFNQIFQKVIINKSIINFGNIIDFSLFFLDKYKTLRELFLMINKNLSSLYDNQLIDFINNNDDISDFNHISFPKINSNILLDTQNKFSLLIESIIIIESIISLYKYLKRFIIIFENEQEINKNYLKKKFELYKISINELKEFLYTPLCNNILTLEPIKKKMLNQKWDLTENEINNNNIKDSFINYIISQFNDVNDKLDLLSCDTLTNKSKLRFLNIVLNFIFEFIMNNLINIKRINNSGRNELKKEIEIFKENLKNNYEIKYLKIEKYFDKIEKFLDSYNYKEEELLNYAKNNNIEYKYIMSIVNNGNYLINIPLNNKNNLKEKIEEIYLERLKKLENILNEIDEKNK